MDNYELERHRTNARMLLHMVEEFPSPYGQAMLEIIAADYQALIDEQLPVVVTAGGTEVPDDGDE